MKVESDSCLNFLFKDLQILVNRSSQI